jgi:hypothetical protein
MASFHSAGYISFKPVASSSNRMAMTFSAPQIRPAAILEDGPGTIGSLTSALCQSAAASHRLELEDVDRRMHASRQLKDTILNLKERLARRVMLRVPLAVVEEELAYKAS